MFKTSSTWLTGAAVIAGLALTSAASAQDTRGAAPAPAPTRPGADPATPAEKNPEAPAATRREAQAAGQPAAPAVAPGRAVAGATREEMLKQLASQETEHRGRAAKIARLRELAQSEGKADRLEAIAKLERTENERFEAMRTKAHAALGDDEFRKTEEHLNKGRRRAQAAKDAAGKDAAAPERPVQERKEAQREKAAEPPQRPATQNPPAAERPATDRAAPERPKATPPAADRPKAEGAQAARPAPQGDRPKDEAKADRGTAANSGARPKANARTASGHGGRSSTAAKPRSL